MNQFAALYLLPPVSVMVPLAIALLWLAVRMPHYGRGAARFCMVLGVAALLATLPAVSKLLSWPLAALAPDWSDQDTVGAVVVPTGGSVKAPLDSRLPSRQTLRRAMLGAALAERHGLPLAISGGSPEELPFSEAGLAVDLLGLDRSAVLVDLTARNTHENALAFARLLQPRGIRRVLAVTDLVHLPRMAASLRAAGFQVFGHSLKLGIDTPIEARDFLPSNRGLRYFGELAAGYGGILYYLARGRIGIGHLTDGAAPG